MQQFLNEIISILGTLIGGGLLAIFRLFARVDNHTHDIKYLKSEIVKIEANQESLRAAVIDQSTQLAVMNQQLKSIDSSLAAINKKLS